MYNDQRYKRRRSRLRKTQTDAERILWSRLRNRRLAGIKFFRQYGVGHYILDFYCPKKRLAIELDGSQHLDRSQEAYDTERTRFLAGHGIKVLRFWNSEVAQTTESVLERILAER